MVPIDLQGQGTTPETIIPVDPVLVSGFSEDETFNKTVMTTGLDSHQYTLGDNDFIAWYDAGATTTIRLAAKLYYFGVIWLGDLDAVVFTSQEGTNRGTGLTTTEIDADATDGSVRYSLQFYESGNSAGSLVIYWNTTAYATSQLAWNASELFLLHGWGIGDSATTNIAVLLISVLTFSLPNVPASIQVIFGASYWASIIYILWFIFKEMFTL